MQSRTRSARAAGPCSCSARSYSEPGYSSSVEASSAEDELDIAIKLADTIRVDSRMHKATRGVTARPPPLPRLTAHTPPPWPRFSVNYQHGYQAPLEQCSIYTTIDVIPASRQRVRGTGGASAHGEV